MCLITRDYSNIKVSVMTSESLCGTLSTGMLIMWTVTIALKSGHDTILVEVPTLLCSMIRVYISCKILAVL